ncbi:MAG: hypothetical protein CVT82_05920 [Alphaproteobacteria bacterium HGW-Alphaproteobacteria-4]|nr:MAG: hypothetical protein CVT82_05920 [Alphaproteobacteria bacterium HGW-Alphaproteobacteria-4]
MADAGPPARTAWVGWLWRTLWRVALIVAAVYAIHLMIGWATEATQTQASGGLRAGVLVLLLLAYALLIATPFVPGVEVGLSLLALEGAWIAPFVYLGTNAGLMLAYLVGERLPYARLERLLSDLRLRRAGDLLQRLAPLGREARLELLREKLPRWCAPLVSRFRYLVIALAVNLPGNSIIGGGGGILFVAGLSRLFRPWAVAGTIALAVAPVPLMIWGFDINLMAMF